MKNWIFINGWRKSKPVWVNRYQLIATAMVLSLGATATYADSEDPPSAELLEFLGEFQTQEGEWFDPLNLLDVTPSDLQQNEAVPNKTIPNKTMPNEKTPSEITQSDIKQTELKRNNEDPSDE
jgi:hypothetical protein